MTVASFFPLVSTTVNVYSVTRDARVRPTVNFLDLTARADRTAIRFDIPVVAIDFPEAAVRMAVTTWLCALVATPVAVAFVAFTETVYAVPGVSPAMTQDKPVVVHDLPPGDAWAT